VYPHTVEYDLDLTVGPPLALVGAPVPDDHTAGAVLARRDLSLEVQVLERVVLGLHRQPVHTRLERDALRYRPRGGHAVVLEPEVPVQSTSVVLLHHESESTGTARRGTATGLGRHRP